MNMEFFSVTVHHSVVPQSYLIPKNPCYQRLSPPISIPITPQKIDLSLSIIPATNLQNQNQPVQNLHHHNFIPLKTSPSITYITFYRGYFYGGYHFPVSMCFPTCCINLPNIFQASSWHRWRRLAPGRLGGSRISSVVSTEAEPPACREINSATFWPPTK